ncbi:hypothetical protein ZEAMMB73_Zm00001d020120 [Zea mays]|uniref:Uncharacterized protein n=1 Tax=Zea mays TaxID=4577 RepID=A0A1D6I281_MAIZE|nr:hypothetical protein ZEAMMB73_Zm00001d020120 [Zea mays]
MELASAMTALCPSLVVLMAAPLHAKLALLLCPALARPSPSPWLPLLCFPPALAELAPALSSQGSPSVFSMAGTLPIFCRFCTTGLPSNVTVEVGDMSFHLHKFPLLSKSAFLERSIEENSDQEECIIKLNDIPGGAKSFELVARFCYGVKIELSPANAVYLRCASKHLEMTEEI